MTFSSHLYAIVDQDLAAAHGWGIVELAAAYLRGGVRVMQIRAKRASGATLLAWCDEIVRLTRDLKAQVIVNDRADVALMADASGVHLGQDDLPAGAVRALLRPGAFIGVSTHTEGEVEAALQEPIDYLAVGPVFATRTKLVGHEAVGLEFVRWAVGRAGGRPVVAIGGISLAHARSVMEAGAAAVAVIADLIVDDHPEARARTYIEALDGS